MTIKCGLPGALLLSAVLLLSACSKDSAPGPANSYLISATRSKSGDVTVGTLQTVLAYSGYGKYATLPRTNVTLYRVSYWTQYPAGTTLRASGVFFIPAAYDPSMPTMVYTHGTIDKSQTPSQCLASPTEEMLICAVACSSFGCAVLMPDYVGYGDSQNIIHPYIHGESLAQASFDMVRAFGEYAAGAGLTFDGRLFITGYSEGGYAAVALQRKVQDSPAGGLRTVKAIAGSGPYDNVAFAREVLAQTTALDPTMIATYLWAMEMYKTDYSYSKGYGEIFSASDNALLGKSGYNMAYLAPATLTGLHTDPSQLFQPAFIDGVETGSDTEFTNILEANSLTDFAPADSLILVCGSADDFVYPTNTLDAYNAMHAKGCPVKMYEFPGVDHTTTLPYYLDILLGRLQGLQ